MSRKFLLCVLLTFSLLLSSCYPELSVQQYDKLREDLETLDTERQELRGQVVSLETELTAIKVKNKQILAYIRFLEKLESTQSSEKILLGQFDVNSLIHAKDELMNQANELGDNDIAYYLGLMKPDNDSQTVAAYYKVIEYCLKKMKQNIE